MAKKRRTSLMDIPLGETARLRSTLNGALFDHHYLLLSEGKTKNKIKTNEGH